MPTSFIHVSLGGTLHKKFNPLATTNTVNTNKALVGHVKRETRRLEYIEWNAFCRRVKIPCGVKNNGTITQ